MLEAEIIPNNAVFFATCFKILATILLCFFYKKKHIQFYNTGIPYSKSALYFLIDSTTIKQKTLETNHVKLFCLVLGGKVSHFFLFCLCLSYLFSQSFGLKGNPIVSHWLHLKVLNANQSTICGTFIKIVSF